ncbi:BMP family ABC transporter substrate-binding protein [Bacillus sp. V3B]|uniref:BMP family ABC transporter substrate-binding protein n=1 Tax=Bacillus sp. V3B TaxID=2804915 RepID=UPI002736D411|nr:BMP family ABC transporter substrate-binding protein [Bacillus sp. V3B]MCQ6274319.1 BMP family ABC transporter substrate-binding protein [Bacillus sp. V3B]
MKRFKILLLCLLFLLTSCGQAGNQDGLKKVGLLVPDTINDQAWGTKGYRGILKIQDRYHIDVYYKESMNSQTVVERAVKEFVQKEVNLIFGHGHEFAEYFTEISQKYPDIHFITFNGDAKNANVTSLNFESYAMGFFAGMMAGHMTKTNHIGILPAFEWQPEIKGFYDGAKYQNDQVQVEINYVHDFDDEERALQLLDKMIANDADVIYPAGDRYSVPAIEKIKEKGLYAIGYVSDQSDLGNNTVLTSTIQHVDALYEVVAEKFNKGNLESGNLSYDFQDNVVSLGPFSPIVNQNFIDEINEAVKKYKETGQLPNQ